MEEADMQKAEVLLEDISPNGSMQAIVEQDDRVVYFYLVPSPDTGLARRSCWVRNLQPGPEELDTAAMQAEQAPLLPRRSCRHPVGAAPCEAETLRVIWFEEGDAAALLEESELLAVIPGWSGKDFHGFARDCIDRTELCWPLGDAESNRLFDRVTQAEQYWASWKDPGPQWEQVQAGAMTALEDVLGKHSNYYVIDGGYWPPKAMIRVPAADHVCMVTIGVGIRPQPLVEMAVKQPQEHRRIELGLCLGTPCEEEQLIRLAQYLSAQTSLPWSRYTWLGNGDTVPCDVLPANPSGPPFTAVMLLANPAGAPEIDLPPYRGDRINLLWMVPITERELEYATSNGSAALIQKLEEAGAGWICRPRPEAKLARLTGSG
jgi:hypothetical protein